MNTLRFLLGQELIELESVSPTLTVLNYLREEEKRIGTKEGCAEGDCGACTVVIAEVVDDRLHYRAVNACIVFLATLDGKQLLTVEDLKTARNELHPVQQSMVESHASQCGFCTPGFVMSGFAEYQNRLHTLDDLPEPQSDEAATTHLTQVFAGNLCRCTGYGPIIEAGKSWLNQADKTNQQAMTEAEAKVIAQLKAIQPQVSKTLIQAGQTYIQPNTIPALADALAKTPGATLLAGGTDIGLWVTKQHRALDTVIYLGGIQALKRIEVRDGQLEIGAAVTYSEALPVLIRHFPWLEEYLYRHSSTQIRNSGTVVGNIANGSPIGDMPPVLIALNAEITLTRQGGQRHLPLEDYFIAYGKQDRQPTEFIECVRIPLLNSDSVLMNVYKISKRFEQDISSVSAAFYIELDDQQQVQVARLCFGGMAATPKRATHCEQALLNKPWTEATVHAAAERLGVDFTPLSDFRASREYRLAVAANLLKKFFIQQQKPNQATQISYTGGLIHA
ncbi:xanthine dehydrogenase small subunit [Halothiobacillus neapolitanus]|uniref:Xanthine dehydrogenase, small subunit n=1 Tax=Halothiobacillus neapolitanus (strain ATCC 23641 / DSM 15147 / CIP 104769 / NCIMB 8539 / c2) TaxID=555778 RepID=D0KZ32_HALNC|nr:xanthine dehydrogenase small subunit [Halothiobacillus neapolitanus]ACX95705.1 xanthine dehydrogenase, small subunit [Halothiobacillus neapolitanus c2]TDN66011.1 xanthine dehydrogenase small subunit [Halothiobacillus neapolitanus]